MSSLDEAYDRERTKPKIYVDELGRRRVDRGQQGQPPPPADQRIAALEATVARLTARLEKVSTDFYGLTICGPGFSGCGTGISYDPASAGAGGGGGGGGTPYPIELCDGTTLDVLAINIVPP